MLVDGFHDIPPGKLVSVVTYLEMRARVSPRFEPSLSGVALRWVEVPESGWYRDLFLRVGGLDWLWFSRLAMAEAELAAILSNPKVEVYALELGGDTRAEGFIELDFRIKGDCELAFFGVTGKLLGSGAGRWLMNQAIDLAWSRPITRFHVHTCSLDSPRALGFYLRSGFVPIRQKVEIVPDPRLAGLLPREAGTDVPIFLSD